MPTAGGLAIVLSAVGRALGRISGQALIDLVLARVSDDHGRD